ncbi:MAG: hypothetical protein JSV26_09330 [bacterium]|nr:MAG: hypothetical protein JSV26_09330 [bacterium]
MIGIVSRPEQRATVEEFFQLFKVPWEFHQEGRRYRVLIVTEPSAAPLSADLNLLFSPGYCPVDGEHGTEVLAADRGSHDLLRTPYGQLPIHTDLCLFRGCPDPIVETTRRTSAGYRVRSGGRTTIRIGFDLFAEVEHLLRGKQGVEHALHPTVEILIATVRRWILEAGIPLLEIPPVPAGFKFISCLTHDVDFMGIREHIFDRSLFGFIYRALFSYSLTDLVSGRASKKLLRNLRALLSLPGIYLGLTADIWNQLDRYLEIEGERKSTFYFLPYKGRPGDRMPGHAGEKRAPGYRSSRYDVQDLKDSIRRLVERGHEVSLHGLDAWCSSERGKDEFDVIRRLAGVDRLGVRMHWLYFSEESPRALDDAGFFYDSTLGYNETVGFRSGTTQVYRLPDCSRVLELPLHVQDTAMLYPARMNLSESDAFTLCQELISKLAIFGGVLTVNWHQRSLGPERNWDEFYLRLLAALDSENVWFATGGQAVRWFMKRRSVSFTRNSPEGTSYGLVSHYADGSGLPDLTVRHYTPDRDPGHPQASSDAAPPFTDTSWSGSGEITLTL